MGGRTIDRVVVTAAALGTLTGLRSMAAPTLLAHEMADGRGPDGDGLIENLLGSEAATRLLALMAGGEMLLDKAKWAPDRTSALPLIGRAVIGGLTAAIFATQRKHSPWPSAAIGAAAALASTFAIFHLRRAATERLDIPDRLVGLLEDGLVLAAGRVIMQAMEE